MAAQEIKRLIPNVSFEKILHVAEKVKGVAQVVFGDDLKSDWIILDAADLTKEKLDEFIAGRRRG